MRGLERGVAFAGMVVVALAGSGARAFAQGPLPEGHSSVDEGSGPHGGEAPGTFQPPEDVEQEDATLPPGTITVDLRDGDGKAVRGESITLGMLINSIAKGDSRRHLQQTTDDEGRAVFRDLQTASNIAYRVSAGYQGGAFAALPFQLQQAKAMHVVLHVYPVTRELRRALIVCEATVAADLKDDRIQIEEALTIYNLGRTAWQPDDVRLALPDGFTAFSTQASMSDQGVDQAEGGARLRGTFPPGRHDVEFRWQLPWSEEKDVDFQVGLPPHVAIARVMMSATSEMKLAAVGFPATELRRDTQGQSFQVTERHLGPDDTRLSALSVQLRDLPTPGPGRNIATFLAACGVALGLFVAVTRRGKRPAADDATARRQTLLDDLVGLEQARAAGDVGPRTYERARRDILDAVARTLLPT